MIINCDTVGNDDETRIFVMKSMRNAQLAGSDWTQMPDSPLSDSDKQAWATYRQALRDFPATWTPGPTADFPDPPT
jgi:hypothetical protein